MGMANEFYPRKFKVSLPQSKSVMFAVEYKDGRTAYFVIEGHGTGEENYLAVQVAQERQRTGELPEGVILTVKRVR